MLIMQEYLPRKTYSFELSPGNAEKFTETRRLNNLPEDKCILIKKAVSEKKGTALINDSAFQGTTLLEKGNIEIETTDIDSFVKENNLTLTTLLVVGDAIDNREGLSRLYADEFKHLFRH